MIIVLTVTGAVVGFVAWVLLLAELMARGAPWNGPTRPRLLWLAAAVFVAGVFLAALWVVGSTGGL